MYPRRIDHSQMCIIWGEVLIEATRKTAGRVQLGITLGGITQFTQIISDCRFSYVSLSDSQEVISLQMFLLGTKRVVYVFSIRLNAVISN